MKKMLAIVLTLVILASLAVPALAVEARSRICPACGGTAYEDYKYTNTSVNTTCENSKISHYHIKYYKQYVAECEDCGNIVVLGSKVYYRYFCSKSGLYYEVN